jgi:hypothetical protein
MPCYEEVAHIPLFVHHPGYADQAGTRRTALTHSMDLMPTFLEIHGAEKPAEVLGHSLLSVLGNDKPVRDAAIFGVFGSALNITDGRYVFFLYPEHVTVDGLYQYTVMPTTLNFLFEPDELAQAELVAPFVFTKGARVMRIPAIEKSPFNPWFGPKVFFDTETILFDLEHDPRQENGFRDSEIETELSRKALKIMRDLDVPVEIYRRFGLPAPVDAGPLMLTAAE